MRKSDEKKPFYEISDRGRDYLENPREEIEGEEHKQSASNIARNGAEGTKDIVLTQANIFNDIGKRLRVGIGRRGKQEGTPLEAIIYSV